MGEVETIAAGQPVVHEPVKAPKSNKAPNGGKKLWGVVAITLVVLLLLGCVAWKHLGQKQRFDENNSINVNEYQALFLTNGQVYFGHLSDLNNKYVSMKDIYYLQVQQSQNLQQGTGTNANSQVSLAKLGSELHGPEDQMHIASGQVLFWENLKNDSKVTQAITKYRQSQ